MKTLLITILIILSSCGTSPKKYPDFTDFSEMPDRDYIDHLAKLGESYLKNGDVKEIKLTKESIDFLNQTFERITGNNQTILTQEFKPSFHIILNKNPLLFSLPHSHFVFTSGLIEKYLKSEELFIAVMTAEILRSDRNIYEKKIMIPIGFYSTDKMLQLTKIQPEIKYQVNEWSYFLLKRAGYDPTAYLNWIQIQNRNNVDFSQYLGGVSEISKEEHYFKNFIAKQGLMGVQRKINEANSSKAFYKFLNNIVSTK